MRVFIPTYNRPEILQKKALAYLERCEWAPAVTFILVADEEQGELYCDKLPEQWWPRVRIAAPGLQQSRSFARELYCNDGDQVIWMDDDTASVHVLVDEKHTREVGLDMVSEIGFEAAEVRGVKIWGVYPTLNPMFMGNRVRLGLYNAVGCFYGEIIDKDPALDGEFGDSKEDYERCLLHYEKHGGIVRLDWFAAKHQYRGNSGGIEEKAEQVETNVRLLEQRWPGYVRRNEKRKSGVPEILLKEKWVEAWT